jgi:two-component system, NtrC family, response regulator AtoC
MARLLLVEDERLLRWALSGQLKKAGHTVSEASSLATASIILRQQRPDVVLLDIQLEDGNGLDFLERERDRLADSAVIVLTAGGRIEDAVRAMKLGASDFLAKPVEPTDLLEVIGRATAMHRERLEAEVSRRSRERARGTVIANSPAMREALKMAETVAASGSTTVLILGDTGSGKEVVARYIHQLSPRAAAPLQALNCAALPENLVESELFGYEKGAFTDAKGSRKGLFELADGGTVVLDEIGELPLPLQSKLLRFLEERTLRRLGGVREIAVDVRIIALTNRSLREHVRNGQFREDLFHRLHVFPITVPPLRERREDIIPLALEFARQFGAACGRKFEGLTPDLEERLLAHPWTGNVRELRNLIERAAILETGNRLTGQALPLAGHETMPIARAAVEESIVPLDEIEFIMVERALRASGGNQSQAARLLQVTRDQLRYRVKRYRAEGKLSVELAEEAN